MKKFGVGLLVGFVVGGLVELLLSLLGG